MKKEIYLDNNATTKVDPEVFKAMKPFLTDLYGNASSMHTFGGQVRRYIDDARRSVAKLIGAEHDNEVIFTACGTESDNTAIRSALDTQPGKRHIITTAVEHPAVRELCMHLEKQGYRVTYLPVDRKGRLNLDDLKKALSEETAIVSVMWANNETGVIFPIEEIVKIVKDVGVLFHTDAVQAVGKIPINMKESAIDFLSLSGHKLHAPKGVGALYVRKGTKFAPFMIGGHQEENRRAGTENVASIVALGKACEIAAKYMEDENTRIKALRDKLENSLLEAVPDSKRNGVKDERLPNTANISFEYIEGESILLLLNELGICASSGSACTTGSLEPSHVLRAMDVPYTMAHGSVRFSLSRYNTEKEIDFVVKELPPIIKRLREISPFGKK